MNKMRWTRHQTVCEREGKKKQHSVENGDYITSNGLWHVRRYIANETKWNDTKKNCATLCMLMGELMRFWCVHGHLACQVILSAFSCPCFRFSFRPITMMMILKLEFSQKKIRRKDRNVVSQCMGGIRNVS